MLSAGGGGGGGVWNQRCLLTIFIERDFVSIL